MTVPIEATTRVRVSPSVYSREFGDELVLLDFGRGEYFALDEVGATIFRKLEAGGTVGDVANALVERYDVSSDVALRDIVDLVATMKNEGLLEVFGGSGV